VDEMTEHPPGGASQAARSADDALALKLLVAHRMLAGLTDPDARIRLQLRFLAICTALKLPGASKARGARRLDRLIADAERARNGK
jgi:hypothetical protein